MITFNGNDIEITRGDTLVLQVPFVGAGIDTDTVARFTIKKKADKSAPEVFSQDANLNTDLYAVFYMSSSETDIKPGTYYWDIRLIIPHEGEEDEVRTPMEYAAFTVLGAVGNVDP